MAKDEIVNTTWYRVDLHNNVAMFAHPTQARDLIADIVVSLTNDGISDIAICVIAGIMGNG